MKKEIAIEKCGFYLPECAYYGYINDSPDTADKAKVVKKAMEATEAEIEISLYAELPVSYDKETKNHSLR